MFSSCSLEPQSKEWMTPVQRDSSSHHSDISPGERIPSPGGWRGRPISTRTFSVVCPISWNSTESGGHSFPLQSISLYFIGFKFKERPSWTGRTWLKNWICECPCSLLLLHDTPHSRFVIIGGLVLSRAPNKECEHILLFYPSRKTCGNIPLESLRPFVVVLYVLS